VKATTTFLVILPAAVVCAGCNGAPAIDVLGSFFPAWMVCVIAAVVFAFVVRSLLLKYRLESDVGNLAIFYPSVVVFFSCLLWLLLFR
jgi:YtcA family